MKTHLTALLCLAALCTATTTTAASPKGEKTQGQPHAIGVKQMANPVIIPQTTIQVSITVKREHIVKGPYAKYSQKYLGITAPLNDKTSYTITSASLAYGDLKPLKAGYLSDCADTTVINKPLFTEVCLEPIVYAASQGHGDMRTSMREKSLDQMAADAANALFTLRKRRFDLITGEFGENVFGAGLPAALDEISRLEDNYLSLFTGKKSTEVYEVTIDVTPSRELDNIVVCRFSESDGIVDRSDLSGEPVILDMTATTTCTMVDSKAQGKNTLYVVVPTLADCKLWHGLKVLAQREIPLPQAGNIIEITGARQ
ncbi:MAG: DUF4831 family protein [Rikenellaceae bacterium]|nr:DUF4831 family protein [Rikenellaceae bacterium]